MKAESLEKLLNLNLVSETTKKTELLMQVCIQVSNYPFDVCKFGALSLSTTTTNFKGLHLFFFNIHVPCPAVFTNVTLIITFSFIQDLFVKLVNMKLRKNFMQHELCLHWHMHLGLRGLLFT